MKKIKNHLRKTANLIIAALFFVSFLSPLPVYAVGEIEIDSWTDLNNVRNDLTASYILTRDLTTSDVDYAGLGDDWTPIGESETPFTGTFDGRDFEIQGLTVTSGGWDNRFALFSITDESALITNIYLTSINITVLDQNYTNTAGALVGYNEGTISNSHTDGIITALDENIFFDSANIGGLVGWNMGFVSASSSSVGIETNGNLAGGLVGRNNGTISASFASGNVVGSTCVGGFVGYNHIGYIYDSYSSGNVVSTNYGAGGFAGYNYGDIITSYSTGNVQGVTSVGGFVGDNGWDSVYSSFSTGAVNGTGDYIGGFIGASAMSYYNSGWLVQEGLNAVALDTGFGGDPVAEITYNATTSDEFYDYSLGVYTDETYNDAWDFAVIWDTVLEGTSYPVLRWQNVEAPADTTPPTYENLPGETRVVNLTEGELITTNPYLIKVNPDDDVAVEKVEFYVDGVLICTDTTPDEYGVYSCAWDTSKYHSDIRIVTYDTSGNTTELLRSVAVDPSLYTLPDTGMRFWDYLRYFIDLVF